MTTQRIFRNASSRNRFTPVLNSLIRDERLGWEEKALLIYVLSLPDNWEFNPDWLSKTSRIGRNKAWRYLRNWQKLGYCLAIKHRDERGRHVKTEYLITDDPNRFYDRPSPLPDINLDPATATDRSASDSAMGHPAARSRVNHVTITEPSTNHPSADTAPLTGNREVDSQPLTGNRYVENPHVETETLQNTQSERSTYENKLGRTKNTPSLTDETAGAALLFSPEAIKHAEDLGAPVADLINRIQVEATKRQIHNPSGYLVQLAREHAAATTGLTAEQVKAITSPNLQLRGTAFAIATGYTKQLPPERELARIKQRLARRGLDPKAVMQEWLTSSTRHELSAYADFKIASRKTGLRNAA